MLRGHPDVVGITVYGWLSTRSSRSQPTAQLSAPASAGARRHLVTGAHVRFRHRERDREISNAETALQSRRVPSGRPQDPLAQGGHPALGRPSPDAPPADPSGHLAATRSRSRAPLSLGISSSSGPTPPRRAAVQRDPVPEPARGFPEDRGRDSAKNEASCPDSRSTRSTIGVASSRRPYGKLNARIGRPVSDSSRRACSTSHSRRTPRRRIARQKR